MNQPPTPGPWIYAYGAVYQRHGDSIYLTDESANRLMLADRSNPRTTPCERDANARLCAAAPSLLEACQAALNELYAVPTADLAGTAQNTRELLRNAIALACPDTPAPQRIP